MNWKRWGLIGGGALGLAFLTSRVARAQQKGLVIFFWEGGQYQTTLNDWLWLARACTGETENLQGQKAVSWCLVQRFAARAQRGRTETFTNLLRAFSQPVNPIWSSHDACRDGRGCCGSTMGMCSPARIANRLRIQSQSWEDIKTTDPELHQMILNFAYGRPPHNEVMGYTNFAADYQFPQDCSVDEGKNIDGNCFVYADPPLEGSVTIRVSA